MLQIKKIFCCSFLLLLATLSIYAQPQPGLLDQVYAVSRIQFYSHIANDIVVEETNTLALSPDVVAIPALPDSIEVGMLVTNAIYMGTYRPAASFIVPNNRYTWVFLPADMTKICNRKGITKRAFATSADAVRRVCQLLGLSDLDTTRDLVVYLKVKKTDLFRPAYEPDITKTFPKGTGANKNVYRLATNDAAIKYWFINTQNSNNYPWTRLGYTFDWHNEGADYKGVPEFVLKPGSMTRFLKVSPLFDILP